MNCYKRSVLFLAAAAFLCQFAESARPDTATWNVDASGSWQSAGNWISTTGTAPNSNTVDVTFGDKITQAASVLTNIAVTARSLRFNNANAYAIGGTWTITLASFDGASAINVDLGSHLIQTSFILGNTTSISAAAGARLDFSNSLNMNSQTLNIGGPGQVYLNNILDTVNGTVNNSGNLGGRRINGDLNNNPGGKLLPGQSPGTLTVDGNFTQVVGAGIDLKLGGRPLSPVMFDRLVVLGNASLAGTVDVSTISFFSPVIGDVYSIIQVSSGVITNNGIDLAAGDQLNYRLDVGATSVTLTVIPEPVSAALWLVAAVCATAIRPRSRRR